MNFKNNLAAYFEIEMAVIFVINRDIVDVVIRNMLFNMNDKDFVPTYE